MAANSPPIVRPPINTLPTAFLGLFGLKSFGKSPAYFGTDLQGIYELREHYFSTFTVGRGATTTAGAIASAAVGFFPCNTAGVGIVPAGKAWVLIDLLIRVPGMAAGDTVSFSPALGHPNAAGVPGEPEALAAPQLFTGLATATLPALPMDPGHRGRILMPGTAIGINLVQAVQAVARTAESFLRFIEVDV